MKPQFNKERHVDEEEVHQYLDVCGYEKENDYIMFDDEDESTRKSNSAVPQNDITFVYCFLIDRINLSIS